MKDHIMVSRQTQMTKLRGAHTAKEGIHSSTKSSVQTSNTYTGGVPFCEVRGRGVVGAAEPIMLAG